MRYFGTCPRCGQGVRLLKSGRVAKHQRKVATADGSMLMTLTCGASGKGLAVEVPDVQS